jgi:hypothetical protein
MKELLSIQNAKVLEEIRNINNSVIKKSTRYIKGVEPVFQGDTFDLYEIPGHPDKSLLVETDRIKVGGIVHLSEVPDLGHIRLGLRRVWSGQLSRLEHLTHDVVDYVISMGNMTSPYLSLLRDNGYDFDRSELIRRSAVVRNFHTIPYEFNFKSYLADGVNLSPKLKAAPVLDPVFLHENDVYSPVDRWRIRYYYDKSRLISAVASSVARKIITAKNGLSLIQTSCSVGVEPQNDNVCLISSPLDPDESNICFTRSMRPGFTLINIGSRSLLIEVVRRWSESELGPLEFDLDGINSLYHGYYQYFDWIAKNDINYYQQVTLALPKRTSR